ncbi:hypothetical protein HMI56_005725 [Coelomomyces lativittatus]|nr:hypothetical protein HMI56_005725 [Coelomomyces lativittatus]
MTTGLRHSSSFRMALIQLKVTANKAKNLSHAKEKVLEAASKGANVIVLPECFNSPYGVSYFSQYAEDIPGGESSMFLSELAKEAKIYLVGGSIPEKDKNSSKFFNSCTIWSPEGCFIFPFFFFFFCSPIISP